MKNMHKTPGSRPGMSARIGIAIVAIASMIAAMPLDSYAAAKSARLLCGGYTGKTALTDFQALVKLSATNDYGFDYADCDAADGSDIWFTDAAGNVIPHEVDSWSANGDSFVWVKIPSVVPSTDASFPTAITMHWGDSAGKQTTEDGVWTGFAGVWHMNASGTTTEKDASGNGLDAVPSTKSSGGGDTSKMVTTAGVVGKGRVNVDKTALVASSYTDKLTSKQTFTASGWFHFTGTFNSSKYPVLVAGEPSNWYACVRTSPTLIQALRTSQETQDSKTNQDIPVDNFQNNYVYFTFVIDGTSAKVYSNGSSKREWKAAGVRDQSDDFNIGNRSRNWTSAEDYGSNTSWLGNYDEVRLYDGAQTPDRIAADYATMSEPTTFLTGDNSIVAAEWSGAAGTGDISDSGNWKCYDALGNLKTGVVPTEATDVTIKGDGVKMQVASGTTLTAKSVTVTNCTLGADCDWTGLGALVCTDGAAIDLNGHDLKVVGLGGAAMFTNSVDATTADLDVTFNTATDNAATAIGGNLRFVKRGSGAFTSSKAQTYTGGTVVAAGQMKQTAGTDVADAYDATWTIFGTGEITVDSGATYTTQSKKAYRNHIVLNGGTLENNNAVSRNITNIIARVTANSTITQTQNIIFGDGSDGVKCDMGGHTLTVKIAEGAYFQLQQNFTDTYGKITLSGTASNKSGYLQTTDTGFTVNATNIDFEVGCRLNPKVNDKLKVRNYKQTGSFGTGYGSAATDKWIEVYGTFIPQTQYFTGCVMQDGSSIDLSAKSAPWYILSSLTPNSTSTGATQKWVSFADGATVTLLLGSRQIDKTTRIVAWGDLTRPDNFATLKFNGVLKGNTVPLAKRQDGLYLSQALIIIIR